jgi:acyl-coenzyme A thioesterase PaaI-like protein
VVYRDGDEAVAHFSPTQLHQGYPERFHGGLVGLLVDEMLVYAGLAQGLVGMTASVSYRLRKPTPLHSEIELRSKVDSRRSRGYKASVRLLVADQLVAEGNGTCLLLADPPEDLGGGTIDSDSSGRAR